MMTEENSPVDWPNIRLSIIGLFKKYNNGRRMLPLCKIVYGYLIAYNKLYHSFFLKRKVFGVPKILRSSFNLVKAVCLKKEKMPYDLLEKIVFHRPDILQHKEISVDENLISIISNNIDFLNIRFNNLTLNQKKLVSIIKENNLFCPINEPSLGQINDNKISSSLAIQAIKQNVNNFRYMINPTEKMSIEAVKHDPSLLRFIVNCTDNIYITALEYHKNAYMYIKYPSSKVEQFYLNQTKFSYVERFLTEPISYMVIGILWCLFNYNHIKKRD